MDTVLRVTDLALELQRTEVVETLMPPLAIIEPFNKCKDLTARVVAGLIRLVMH